MTLGCVVYAFFVNILFLIARKKINSVVYTGYLSVRKGDLKNDFMKSYMGTFSVIHSSPCRESNQISADPISCALTTGLPKTIMSLFCFYKYLLDDNFSGIVLWLNYFSGQPNKYTKNHSMNSADAIREVSLWQGHCNIRTPLCVTRNWSETHGCTSLVCSLAMSVTVI